MKTLPAFRWSGKLHVGTAARWFTVTALCLAPTVLRYELMSEPTFACTRDGKLAGTCHVEPTLRQRIGLDKDWAALDPEAAPRPSFMPAMRIEDIGMATPSGGNHYVQLHGSPACWSKTMPSGYSNCVFAAVNAVMIPLDESYSPSEERSLAVEFNRFLQSEKVRSFRVRQPAPFHPAFALFYVVAALVTFLNFRRSLALRTAAWVKAVEAIPASRVTAYRGQG